MKREDMNYEERIIAYISGDMDAAEAAEFEKNMAADAALRARVEQVRQAAELARTWAALEPPGADRVAHLRPPLLPRSRHRVSTARRYVFQPLAAAALFLLGYYLGTANTPHDDVGARRRPDRVALQPTPAAQHTPAPVTVTTPAIAPAPTPPAVAGEQHAPPAEPIRTIKEDGRIIIETTLAQSGSRATWVVDGGFQLAQVTKGNIQ